MANDDIKLDWTSTEAQGPSPSGRYRQSWAQGADWRNFGNHTDVVDPQRHEAMRAAQAAEEETDRRERFAIRYALAATRPPKFLSTDEAMSRNKGFIVMNYTLIP